MMRVDIEKADGTKIAIEGDDEPVLRIARELAQPPRLASFDPLPFHPYPWPLPVLIPTQPAPYVPPFGPPAIYYCDQAHAPSGGLH